MLLYTPGAESQSVLPNSLKNTKTEQHYKKLVKQKIFNVLITLSHAFYNNFATFSQSEKNSQNLNLVEKGVFETYNHLIRILHKFGINTHLFKTKNCASLLYITKCPRPVDDFLSKNKVDGQ